MSLSVVIVMVSLAVMTTHSVHYSVRPVHCVQLLTQLIYTILYTRVNYVHRYT